MVVDPPPSRLMAFCEPSHRTILVNSYRFIPEAFLFLPSTVIRRILFLVIATAVRGCLVKVNCDESSLAARDMYITSSPFLITCSPFIFFPDHTEYHSATL